MINDEGCTCSRVQHVRKHEYLMMKCRTALEETGCVSYTNTRANRLQDPSEFCSCLKWMSAITWYEAEKPSGVSVYSTGFWSDSELDMDMQFAKLMVKGLSSGLCRENGYIV